MKTNVGPSAKSVGTALAAVAVTLSVSAASLAQDNRASKHYVLPASTENVQWGWYDINEKPKLTIKSGDTVQMIVGDHAVAATVKELTDDHDTAIDFFVVTAELSKTNRPTDVKVGATGFVRIADKGAVR